MRFLLFLLCLIFSWVFYSFEKFSFFWGQSLFLQSQYWAIAFLLLGFFFFFYFWKTKPITLDEENKKESYFNTKDILKHISNFYKKYFYYIGFIFFYISIYIIFSSLHLSYNIFSYIILFFNIFLLLIFFFTNKFFILRDFIKINTILLSYFYIFSFFFLWKWYVEDFSIIYFINSLLLFLLFWVFLTFETHKKKAYKSDPIILSYFSFYTFIWLTYNGVFLFESFSISGGVFWFLLGIFLFYLPKMSPFFSNSYKHLRTLWICIVFLSMIFSSFYVYNSGFNIFLIFAILWGSIFQFFVHRKFQNYFSFLSSFLGIVFLFSYFLFNFSSPEIMVNSIIFSIYFLLSFLLIIFTYVSRLKFQYDTLSLHIFSYIVNIFWVIVFFLLPGNLDLLHIGIILLSESFFVFLSYYKLNQVYQW